MKTLCDGCNDVVWLSYDLSSDRTQLRPTPAQLQFTWNQHSRPHAENQTELDHKVKTITTHLRLQALHSVFNLKLPMQHRSRGLDEIYNAECRHSIYSRQIHTDTVYDGRFLFSFMCWLFN